MEREALKLALEALNAKVIGTTGRMQKTHNAITAIKEALAQPVQEPDALTIAYQSGFYDGKKAALAQPAQEPVKCLDCGSHNVGIPATYDSLINSVKALNT